METERFVAPTINEAIQKVKVKYGKEALIISSRKVRQRGFGFFGKEMIEVVASGDQRFLKPKAKVTTGALPDIPKATDDQSDFYQQPTGYSATGSAKKDKAALGSLSAPAATNVPLTSQMYEVKDMISELKDKVDQDHSQGFELQHMRQEVHELKGIIKSMAHKAAPFYDKDWHENLVSIFQQLMINGVEEKFSRRVIEELQKKVSRANLEDYEYLKLFTARIFIQSTLVENLLQQHASDARNIVTLVGVTGVGKTTTIAKVAAMIKLQDKTKKVGLITLDNFRIGAADQLREYAKIIKAPFKAVTDDKELKSALNTMRDCDWVFIDTPGASQRDAQRFAETQAALQGITNLKNILVLSATTKDCELMEITKSFKRLKIIGSIFTKLDEASSYGVLLNHMIRFKMPLLFLTAGQKVPDDIETASHERLLDLVLNMSEIS